MECVQCQGLMVEHDFFDLEGTQGFIWMRGWRCLYCGHAANALVAANHRLHQSTEHWSRQVPHNDGVTRSRPGRTNRSVWYNGDHSDHR